MGQRTGPAVLTIGISAIYFTKFNKKFGLAFLQERWQVGSGCPANRLLVLFSL
jgi:hypothetical protein